MTVQNVVAVELEPYPLSTLLLSGFLAVTLVLLLLVSVELHRQIQRYVLMVFNMKYFNHHPTPLKFQWGLRAERIFMIILVQLKVNFCVKIFLERYFKI